MKMIDLKPFCSTDTMRQSLMQPFSFGTHTYATNGHIIVRVSKRDDVPELIDKRPKVENLKWGLRGAGAVKIIELPDRETEECGDAWEEMGKPRECCPEKEEGCPERASEGICWKKKSIMVGPSLFDVEYLRLIKALPEYVFYPVPFDPQSYKHSASYFTFDGGDGLLMPVKP